MSSLIIGTPLRTQQKTTLLTIKKQRLSDYLTLHDQWYEALSRLPSVGCPAILVMM